VPDPCIESCDHVAGILSLLCAQAGARTVYAVEASALADIIPQVAKENNFSDVIKVCGAVPKTVTSHINTTWLINSKIKLQCFRNLEFDAFLIHVCSVVHYLELTK
jgi:hypothetical protein